ncbi:hypothetical protein KFL_002310200 [Klebsormidium nitens]|uniref:Uncharacterized protein n=1 Tax=Klebsormidium nitens TaxID=105231 RepID=A0A1Y1I360_KLENI|nr:hypothetical protein KFL_002310200 [Klebsormidium nitens]|eukprot:GAQ85364.1 hypothetical protein KFL_002310200 [Klebsormidium nitens]
MGQPTETAPASTANAAVVTEEVLFLVDSARYGDVEDVQATLDSGVDASAADSSGRTALHMAAANGHENVVQLLLEKGANVNAANQEGNTPLHWAALNHHLQVVKRLLEAGANPGALNKVDRTPVDEALDKGFDDVISVVNTNQASEQVASTSLEEVEQDGDEGEEGMEEERT